MKRKIFTFFCCLFTVVCLQAQTWDGSAGTDWNTPANWSTNAVPLSTGNVIIPGTGITNWPVLAANTTVNSFDMNAGSRLDFNGFTFTVNAAFNVNGAVLNNTNGATDIVLTINGAASSFFGNNTINDNITLNHNSSGILYEGITDANTYNGNASFNYGGTGTTYISYNQKSTFNGNLTINRTVAGSTSIFNNGFTGITGNFSYTNNAGGATYINPQGTVSGIIGGTINITAAGAGNPDFQMKKITNLTAGGTISVQNSGPISIENDTLKVTALNINGFTGGSADDYFGQNSIEGNVSFTDAAGNTGPVFLGGNLINGNTSFAFNGAGFWYEGHTNGNIYNGNASFNYGGTGTTYISYNQKSTFNGNLTINRTVAGSTSIFNNGFTGITGNFSYTNNAGGATYINPQGTVSGIIGGTINITAAGTGNPDFQMKKITNLTAGGTISVQNSGPISIENDTLKVTALNINGFTGGSADDYFGQNSIEGNVSFTDAAGNTGPVYLGGNLINGNTSFAFNGAGFWYEGHTNGNIYNGNASFNYGGTGTTYISYNQKSTFNGNLTVNRTAAGITHIFNNGFTGVTGNFSYTNNVGGNSYINTNSTSATVGGTVNITATGIGNPDFQMKKITNLTAGGTISVQNSGPISIENDTLKVTALNINGFTGGSADDYFGQNSIEGNVSFTDAAGNTGPVFLGGNLINGNTSFASNGTGIWYESHTNENIYNGNITFNRTAGTINFAYNQPTHVNQNLVFNAAAGIDVNTSIVFGGSTNTTIEQLGTQPITIPTLIVNKTGGARVTLNSPVTITASLNFTGGYIYSGTSNNLIFSDNATHTGASDAGYVDGPVLKTGNDVFTFPVGKQNKYAPVSITAPTTITDQFRVQYFKASPNTAGYTTSLHDPTINHISSTEYWMVDRVTGTSDVKVTLSWDAARSGGVTSMPDLRVARWNGSTWKDEGNEATTGTNANGTIRSQTVTSFSPFTLASSSLLNPLPLTLLNFAGSKCNSGVCLLWTTENEINFSHFEVEKSNNGINFSHLTDVSSRNLTERTTYTSKDVIPASSANYYRLKIINTDGSFTYSRIVKIDLAKPITVLVQPNPASDVVYIKGTDGYQQIKIIDMTGKLRLQKNIQNSIEEINISNLPAGIYMIQLMNEKETTTIKLVKQ